jgi:hypothetical protein
MGQKSSTHRICVTRYQTLHVSHWRSRALLLSDVFSDTHDLSLSSYQQQFFKGWIRAALAVPPPAAFSNDRKGIGPLMSSSRTIDLVQDAASDCSVVTSLCAAIARAERGHEQVSTLNGTVTVCTNM